MVADWSAPVGQAMAKLLLEVWMETKTGGVQAGVALTWAESALSQPAATAETT